ncbi:MAG: primase alpha helix C-terminal domain-containing protein [Burkholderiaceae bacterium]
MSGTAAHTGHPLSHWRRLVGEGVAEGARNATIASLAGHLLWHQVDPHVVLELLLSWNRQRCRPPLADDEVAATVASIARTHVRGA